MPKWVTAVCTPGVGDRCQQVFLYSDAGLAAARPPNPTRLSASSFLASLAARLRPHSWETQKSLCLRHLASRRPSRVCAHFETKGQEHPTRIASGKRHRCFPKSQPAFWMSISSARARKTFQKQLARSRLERGKANMLRTNLRLASCSQGHRLCLPKSQSDCCLHEDCMACGQS